MNQLHSPTWDEASKATTVRLPGFLTALAVTGAIGFSTTVSAINPNSAETSTSQALNSVIQSPANGQNVQLDQALTVTGQVSLGAIPSAGRSNVTYVIDVSGSTSASGNDCNSDGSINNGDNFTPADSTEGTVLDCEVGAVMALNDSLGNNGSVFVGIVPFGSRAATALSFISPPSQDGNGNGTSDVDDVLLALDQGGGIVSVSTGTDFSDALDEMTRLFQTRPSTEQRVAYFLTDGLNGGSVTNEANDARDAGIRVEVFSVGRSAAGCNGTSLSEIAAITGGNCVDVQDVDTLTAIVSGTGGLPPTGIDRAEISLNGAPAVALSVDNLGSWDHTFAAGSLAAGANTIEATVYAQDGTAVSADITVNASPLPDDPTTIDPDDQSTPTDPPVINNPDPVYCSSAAADSDGDGWGWENGMSCRVNPDTPTTPTQPAGDDTPACQSAASDPDGDGWGWENGSSCRVTADTGTGDMGGDMGGDNTMGPAYCQSAASDHDADGWGWENGATCLVAGSTFDQSHTQCPHCVSAHADPDGDGWGWENGSTCIVPGSAAAMLVD